MKTMLLAGAALLSTFGIASCSDDKEDLCPWGFEGTSYDEVVERQCDTDADCNGSACIATGTGSDYTRIRCICEGGGGDGDGDADHECNVAANPLDVCDDTDSSACWNDPPEVCDLDTCRCVPL